MLEGVLQQGTAMQGRIAEAEGTGTQVLLLLVMNFLQLISCQAVCY